MQKNFRKMLSLFLAICLVVSMLPVTAIAADPPDSEGSGTGDITVTEAVYQSVYRTTYGWALSDAVKNEDGTIAITVREVPSFEEKTYTTAISLDDAAHTNSVTGVTRADALANGDTLKKNAFVEIRFNAANEPIDMEVIEFNSPVYMDSASYGGELTAQGGDAGNMVAMGWILGKDAGNKTITVGDGNNVTNVFKEEYTLADDVKIYKVNNSTTNGTDSVSGMRSSYHINNDWALVGEGTFDDITVTAKGTDGEIYYTPERYTAVGVFDSNYETSWKDGTAKVKELYLFANPIVLCADDMSTPDGVQYDGTSWYPVKSKLEEKTSFAFDGSCEPIEIMKDRLYDVGDAYTDIYLFIGDDGTISLVDQGNRTASYQYWLNIEKVGYDPRDVDNILLTHGHGDHYQALYENVAMIRRAGGEVNTYINSYSQGATVSNDEVSYELTATLKDNPVLYSVSGIIDWGNWLDFMGDGISIYPWSALGHTNDTGSFVFKATAKDSDDYFTAGDVVSWVYYGGYGARTSMSQGANRLQIVYTMMYQQSVIAPWAQAQSDYVYPLAQHTNQYPQHEIYKAAKIAGIPCSQALTEGAEGISNFMEKRVSVGFYEWMNEAYWSGNDAFGDLIEQKTGFRCDSSGRGYLDTVQAHGPFKRPEGEYTMNIQAVNVIHGYDAFQNKNVQEFASQTNIYGFTLDQGFVIDKDSYTHDPDGWYVQVVGRVNDDYTGGVDYDPNGSYTSGADDAPYTNTWPGGPVEMGVNPTNWVEILRTERFDTQAEAEAYAKALTNNGYTTPYETYSVDGSELYSYNDTNNYPNPITALGASGVASYTVNLSKASEILVGESFEDTFREVMAKPLPQLSDLVIDKVNYHKVSIEGYYDIPVTLNDGVTVRPLKMYVPKNSVQKQPTVFVAVPNGTDSYEFLVQSGWKAVSDKNHITVVLMQPDTGKNWGSYEEESEYLECTYTLYTKSPFIITNNYAFYIAGYGEAANVIEEYAMNTPQHWAGILAVGSTGISAEDVAALTAAPSKIDGITLNEVPIPSWIVSSARTADVERLINYWKDANQTVDGSAATAYAGEYYAPDKNAQVGQRDSEPVAGVYYSTTVLSDCLNEQFASNVWENMFSGVRRYVGLSNWHLREYEDIYELGYKKHNAMVDGGTYTDEGTGTTMSSGEFNREWYVYVPDSVDRTKKAPVIFLFPGRSGTGDEIAARMGWDRTAEEKGAILVSLTPSMGISLNERYNGMVVNPWRTYWTTAANKDIPNDLLYFDYVYDWMLSNPEYKDIVDASRIYASGQSMGGMFTHAVVAARPKKIAAGGACSWVATPGDSFLGADTKNEGYDIPLMVMMGQIDTTVRGGLSNTSGPWSGKSMFDYYINRYDIADAEGRNDWGQFTFMVDNPTCSYKDGIYNNYDFKTEAGYTMFRGVEVVGMQHATIPEETYMMWDDMFSHYSRDPVTGILYYDGNVVDTPKNLEIAGGEPANGVVKTHGISKVFPGYHQLTAVAVEYSGNVTAPEFDPENPAYTIRDYAAPYMREEYDRADPYSEAKVTAIYTNSTPTMREDKRSVPGKYVIIELAQIKEVEPYDGDMGYRPLNNAVLATWRQLSDVINRDDTCERIRKDFSDVIITQNADVKDAANNAVVSGAGSLPELLYQNLTNLELDEFKQGTITTKEKGSTAHFGYYLPKNYDPNKKYPMVVYNTGNSGRLEFSDGAVLGDEPENLGGNMTRDRMALRWLNENEDVIVVAPQTSRLNVPYDYSDQDELSSIIDYFIEEYSVDTGRVYAIGSSIGTRQLNEYLKTNASKIAGFVSANGFGFSGVSNKFIDGYTRPFTGENQKTKAEVLGWGDEVRQDAATYAPKLEAARAALSEVIKNRVPMWYYHAVNDETLPVTGSMTNYEVLRQLYKEEGLSDAEIDKLVKLVLYDNDEMFAEGIVEFHGAVKKASVDPDLGKNLLAIKKGSYGVRFDGGTNAQGDAPQTIFVEKTASSKAVSLPVNTFIRSGYRFGGWNDGSETYQPGVTYTVTKDTVFTAVWSRKSSGGGSSSNNNKPTEPEKPVEPTKPAEPQNTQQNNFSDVQRHWAKDSVGFVVERKLFNGVSDTNFSPDTSMTRGMFVTVLGRLAQANVNRAGGNFSDVNSNAWFAGSVAWAVENGIVNGVGNGSFAPDTAITREQLCVMIVNYAKFAGLKLTDKVSGESFADSGNISDWAAEAVTIAQRAGLIQGKGGNNFDPQGTATRAEVAVMLQRLIENFVD